VPYTWQKLFSRPAKVIKEVDAQADEIRRLKRDLARVTEEGNLTPAQARQAPEQFDAGAPGALASPEPTAGRAEDDPDARLEAALAGLV